MKITTRNRNDDKRIKVTVSIPGSEKKLEAKEFVQKRGYTFWENGGGSVQIRREKEETRPRVCKEKIAIEVVKLTGEGFIG